MNVVLAILGFALKNWRFLILGVAVAYGGYILYSRSSYKDSNTALQQANESVGKALDATKRSADETARNAVVKSRQELEARNRYENFKKRLDAANNSCLNLTVDDILRPVSAEAGSGADGVRDAERK